MSVDPKEVENAHLLDRGQLQYSLFDYLLDCWKRLENVKLQTSRAKVRPIGVAPSWRLHLFNLTSTVTANARLSPKASLKNAFMRSTAPKVSLCLTQAWCCKCLICFPRSKSTHWVAHCSSLRLHVNYTNSPFIAATYSSYTLGASQLVERLLADPDSPSGVPNEFLRDLSIRFKDDGLENIIQPLVSGVAAKARNASILTDWRSPMRALLALIEIPEIAAAIPQVATWNPPNATARQIEIVSTLGPFFKTSGFCIDDVSYIE